MDRSRTASPRSATGGIRPKRRWEWSARDTSGSWYAGTPHRGGFRVLTCDPPRAAREGGGDFVPVGGGGAALRPRHVPHAARCHDAPHGRRSPPPPVETDGRGHQLVARRGGRRRRAAPQRPSLRPRRLGTRTRHRPPAAGGGDPRHTPHRRLFGAGQGQRHGHGRRGRRPPFPRCRSKGGTPPSRRRIPARSAGTNWPRPSAHATTSPPRATRSNATPNDSRRCATATPTEKSISEPVIGTRRLRRERPRPAGRRRRCGHPARNEGEGPAAAGKLSIVRCRL